MTRRLTKQEKAELNGLWDKLTDKEKEFEELEKIDTKEARARKSYIKRRITQSRDKFCNRAIELMSKPSKPNQKDKSK